MKSPAVAFCATLALLLAACRTASAQSGRLVPTYGARFGSPSVPQEPADYRLALIPFISLLKVNRPYVFCAIPYDGAGNAGRVFEALLP